MQQKTPHLLEECNLNSLEGVSSVVSHNHLPSRFCFDSCHRSSPQARSSRLTQRTQQRLQVLKGWLSHRQSQALPATERHGSCRGLRGIDTLFTMQHHATSRYASATAQLAACWRVTGRTDPWYSQVLADFSPPHLCVSECLALSCISTLPSLSPPPLPLVYSPLPCTAAANSSSSHS
jgi:hypothetical protein